MITINFASRNYRLLEGIRLGLAAVNALFLVATIIIIWMGLSLRVDIASMDKKVKEMEAAEEHLRPLLTERRLMIKNLTDMSVLMESRRFSWTQLLTNIEKVFPVGVALDKVEYNPRDHALNLDGTAHSPESLRNLIVGLERANVFKDPYLKHQSLDKGSITFNVVTFYQDKAAGMAQRK